MNNPEGYDLGEKKGIKKGVGQGKREAQCQTLHRLVQWRFAPSVAEQAHELRRPSEIKAARSCSSFNQ